MKILMASTDHDNKLLAVLAFKNLNVANSIDFVTTVDELMNYIKTRADAGHELPDLLLFGLNMIGRDILNEIKLDSRLAKLKIVTFSTHSYVVDETAPRQDSNSQVYMAPDSKELNWILNEICDGLIAKEGWQYSVNRPLLAASK